MHSHRVRNGHIKRLTDPDIQSSVLEVMGTNVSTTYITAPAEASETLGVKLPYLVMIIKNVCPHANLVRPHGLVEEVLLLRSPST